MRIAAFGHETEAKALHGNLNNVLALHWPNANNLALHHAGIRRRNRHTIIGIISLHQRHGLGIIKLGIEFLEFNLIIEKRIDEIIHAVRTKLLGRCIGKRISQLLTSHKIRAKRHGDCSSKYTQPMKKCRQHFKPCEQRLARKKRNRQPDCKRHRQQRIHRIALKNIAQHFLRINQIINGDKVEACRKFVPEEILAARLKNHQEGHHGKGYETN